MSDIDSNYIGNVMRMAREVKVNEPLVKYEQLTEDEQAFMWRIWAKVETGLSEYDASHNDAQTIVNLLNFELIYRSLNKYRFSDAGRKLMVAQKLHDREATWGIKTGDSEQAS